MSSNTITIESLVIKYLSKQPLSEAETERLNAWRERTKQFGDLPEQLRDPDWVAGRIDRYRDCPSDRILEKVTKRLQDRRKATIYRRRKFTFAAAAAVLVVAAGIYLYTRPVLPRGPSISADRSAVTDTGYRVQRTGKVVPYTFELPDGSKVSLNTASTLRYPVVFPGKVRQVELAGEAEFDVKGDAEDPFRILSRNMLVEVLGTHFNVMAYPDDPRQGVALISGSVRVSIADKKKSVQLKEGQLVWIGSDDSLHVESLAHDQDIFDWKDRKYFHFNGKTLDQIFRELARSYNLKLPDLSPVKGQFFHGGGLLSRDLSAAEVLSNILTEKHDLKFSIKGDSLRIQRYPGH